MIRTKSDIQNIEDVKDLVDSFYAKVFKDGVIGYIFREHMEIPFKEHLPKMYRFWESLLLDGNEYRGNPMLKHIQLDRKVSLDLAHFDQWLLLTIYPWIGTQIF